jgi:hypothetical protein
VLCKWKISTTERRVYLTMTIYLLLMYAAETCAWTKAHIGRMVVAGMEI